MDKAQDPIKLSTPLCEVEDYYSSDSSSPSLKQVFQSATEAESSKAIVMLVMTTGTNNLEEEMPAMKAMLERLVKESEKKEARIKLQEEKIARLTRGLKKQPVWFIVESSENKEEERAPVQSETSNEEVHLKKGSKLKNGESPSLMTVKQIQDLIANAVKIQLGGGACNTHLQNSSSLKGKATQNSMLCISSRRAITLARTTT